MLCHPPTPQPSQVSRGQERAPPAPRTLPFGWVKHVVGLRKLLRGDLTLGFSSRLSSFRPHPLYWLLPGLEQTHLLQQQTPPKSRSAFNLSFAVAFPGKPGTPWMGSAALRLHSPPWAQPWLSGPEHPPGGSVSSASGFLEPASLHPRAPLITGDLCTHTCYAGQHVTVLYASIQTRCLLTQRRSENSARKGFRHPAHILKSHSLSPSGMSCVISG